MLGHRVPAHAARLLGRAGAVAGALAAVALAAAGPAEAQTATAPAPPVVKFFVVPHAANPDDVTLFKIAEQTLGDGHRFPDIFQLNQGRPRPDGTPFTDPAQIEPGQVLQLPDDANNPAVHVGPLPATPPPAPSATSTSTPLAAPVVVGESGPTRLETGLVSGAGGVFLGLLGGFWWRRRPRVVPPAAFVPAEDEASGNLEDTESWSDGIFEPHQGILPLPPRLIPEQVSPGTWRPAAAGPSYVYLDTPDTKVFAAVRPGTRLRLLVTGPDDELALPETAPVPIYGRHALTIVAADADADAPDAS